MLTRNEILKTLTCYAWIRTINKHSNLKENLKIFSKVYQLKIYLTLMMLNEFKTDVYLENK